MNSLFKIVGVVIVAELCYGFGWLIGVQSGHEAGQKEGYATGFDAAAALKSKSKKGK